MTNFSKNLISRWLALAVYGACSSGCAAPDAELPRSAETSSKPSEQAPLPTSWRTIDGLKIRYAEGGSAPETLVLFSPWPESIYAFAPVWSELTSRFHVVALDLPGFGQSEARDELFSPARMGDFISKSVDAFGLKSVNAVGLDVAAPSLLFSAVSRPDLYRSIIVGAGAMTYPLNVDGVLKQMIDAPSLPRLDSNAVVSGFISSIHGYVVPGAVREDYLASYAGDRLTRSAALVRAYPTDLATLAPQLVSIKLPVAIVVGRNDPYGLVQDASLLRERLPNARLDILDAGHCVWEERAPEFAAIVTQWANGGAKTEQSSPAAIASQR